MTEESEIAIVRNRGQVTLPSSIRKALGIEDGDPIELTRTPDGVLLRPKKLIDADQHWFWVGEWQAGEREASEDIAGGRVTRFMDDESFLASFAAEEPPRSGATPRKRKKK